MVMLRRLAVGLALALLLSGCATKAYEGPERPRSEVAELNVVHEYGYVFGIWGVIPFPTYKHVTRVIQIDGKRISGDVWHILPGQHTVRVWYIRRSEPTVCGTYSATPCEVDYKTRDLSIVFIAKAGHEYRIPAERRGAYNWLWVEDLTSGKVVAGREPPGGKAR
jgi:hypothetical protein